MEQHIVEKLKYFRDKVVGDEECNEFDDFLMNFFINDDKTEIDSDEEELGGLDQHDVDDGLRQVPDDDAGFSLRFSDDDSEDEIEQPTEEENKENVAPGLKRPIISADEIAFEDPILEDEFQKVENFICGCKSKCSALIGREEILKSRLDMLAFSQSEKDIILMSAIQIGIDDSPTTSCSRRKVQNNRKLTRLRFFYKNTEICRETFKFMHHVSQAKLTKVKKWYCSEGFSHVHKINTGPKNVKKSLDWRGLLHFAVYMKRYANEQGLVLPGRIPGMRSTDADTILLSCSETKKNVCDKFNAARKVLNPDATDVHYRTFCRLWRQLFPTIVIAKPRSDLCRTCQVNTQSIMRSKGGTLQMKTALIQNAQEHLELAMRQRNVYNEMMQEAKDQILQDQQIGPHPCLSFNGTAHYAFDFAQQMFLPSDPMQAGPIYFLTPRKCQLFGICNTGLTKQVNYLIDEAVIIKKGAEVVIDMLHHYLENWGLGERKANLHADNCCAQNKNNFMMAYLLWRIVTKKHMEISLNFMLTGHTKFLPDGAFGQIKQRLKTTKVDCIKDLAILVDNSSTMNVAQVVAHEDGSELCMDQHDWSSFTSAFWRPIPDIQKYHHFRFSSDHPDSVFVREHATSDEVKIKVLKKNAVIPQGLPVVVVPPGLNLKRQHYLYKYIRSYVRPEVEDLVCPKPAEDDVEETVSEPQRKRKK